MGIFFWAFLGAPIAIGRAIRCNLFARASQKGFPLLSLDPEKIINSGFTTKN
jgi:hypothetical protein